MSKYRINQKSSRNTSNKNGRFKISTGQYCKGITKRNNKTKYQVVTTIRGLVSYKIDKMTRHTN